MKLTWIVLLIFITACGGGSKENSTVNNANVSFTETNNVDNETDHSIIPNPLSFVVNEGELIIEAVKFLESVDNEEAKFAINELDTLFNEILTEKVEENNSQITIKIALSENGHLFNTEGYELEVSSEGISILAATNVGLYYGIQTLKQYILTSTEIIVGEKKENITLKNALIKDQPRFEYRGAMLDVARHFFTVNEVKKYIDSLAYYKINKLHLHLTDDQGWRIEIKTWPLLTEMGGQYEVGGTQGGLFTQEQYKEIIDYAAKRYIEVIPEIDMPGHTNAALASYAELNCDKKAKDIYTGMEVGFSSLCLNDQITYQFVNDVIRELAEMTPGKYIHIGGDESLATNEEEYIDFINQLENIVELNGKTLIGWEEIGKSKISERSVFQFWKEAENLSVNTNQNNSIIISEAEYAYLDMKYNRSSPLGLGWAGYIDVEKAYNWEPNERIDSSLTNRIIGTEAPLWTETIATEDDLEYMAFPRLPGYAEIAWSNKESRNWQEYKQRLAKQKSYFDRKDINYYPSEDIAW